MHIKRPLSKAAIAATLGAPFAGFATAPVRDADAPIFRFGVVTDPQYASLPSWRTRHYANSLPKLTEAIGAFNREDLEFVVTLGDLIERDWDSYHPILPLYDDLRHPRFFVPGNHDYAVGDDDFGARLRENGAGRGYYDFSGGGYRFIVVDGGEISLFANPPGSANHVAAEKRLARLTAAGAINAKPWNGAISDAQFAWIGRTLDAARAAGERAIVLSHYPVYPSHDHNLWDDARMVDLLTGYDNVALFINGHNHAGNYGQVRGTHFVNFKGMVETPDVSTYAVVEVHDDRLEIRGYGLEESRTLTI